MSAADDLESARADLRELERPLVQALVERSRYGAGGAAASPSGLDSYYRSTILISLCEPGGDGRSVDVARQDLRILGLLRERLELGRRVADAKASLEPDRYAALVKAGDRAGLMQALTDTAVEGAVVDRVRSLATTMAGAEVARRVADVFARWIITRTKEAEADRLLGR